MLTRGEYILYLFEHCIYMYDAYKVSLYCWSHIRFLAHAISFTILLCVDMTMAIPIFLVSQQIVPVAVDCVVMDSLLLV